MRPDAQGRRWNAGRYISSSRLASIRKLRAEVGESRESAGGWRGWAGKSGGCLYAQVRTHERGALDVARNLGHSCRCAAAQSNSAEKKSTYEPVRGLERGLLCGILCVPFRGRGIDFLEMSVAQKAVHVPLSLSLFLSLWATKCATANETTKCIFGVTTNANNPRVWLSSRKCH